MLQLPTSNIIYENLNLESIYMKYNNNFKLLTICLILSGCAKKQSKSPDVEKTSKSGYLQGEKKIYDEDLEAFVLEEDANALTSQAGQESLIIDESESASLMVDDHKNSSQYGLKAIYFDFDQYTIRADQKSQLAHDLAIVKDLTSKGKTVIIEGHACNSAGSAVYNIMLSEKRAKSIANYLVKNGVKKSMIKTVGRGCEMPIVPGGSREQQAPNRRVETYILEKK